MIRAPTPTRLDHYIYTLKGREVSFNMFMLLVVNSATLHNTQLNIKSQVCRKDNINILEGGVLKYFNTAMSKVWESLCFEVSDIAQHFLL